MPKNLFIGKIKAHDKFLLLLNKFFILLEKIKLIPTRIYETYGMTETLTHVAIKRINGMNKTEIFSALNGITFEKDDRDCLIINAKN